MRHDSQIIRHYVAAGTLVPDDKLPSIRELAKALAVNPTTIVKTYGELEHEGVIEIRHGRGAFVAATTPAWPPNRRRDRLQTLSSQMAVESRQMGSTDAEALAALKHAFEDLGPPFHRDTAVANLRQIGENPDTSPRIQALAESQISAAE